MSNHIIVAVVEILLCHIATKYQRGKTRVSFVGAVIYLPVKNVCFNAM